MTETYTNTPSGVVAVTTPIAFPNPVRVDEPIKVAFNLNKPVDYVTVILTTDAYRVITRNTVPGPFSIGMATVTLDLPGLHLSNGIYYVVVRLPDGTTESVGKLVTAY